MVTFPDTEAPALGLVIDMDGSGGGGDVFAMFTLMLDEVLVAPVVSLTTADRLCAPSLTDVVFHDT